MPRKPVEHNFRVDYLRHRLRPLVFGWWPDHPVFARKAWGEVRRAIDDAYDEALRLDWVAAERERAKARAKVLLQIRKANTSLRKQRERMKPKAERHKRKKAVAKEKAARRLSNGRYLLPPEERKALTIALMEAQEATKSTEV